MDVPIALLGFGVLLLLVGLVGGDLSRSGRVVPVGPLPRSTTTVAGVASILLSLVVHAAEVRVPGGTSISGTTLAGATGPDEPVPIGPAPVGPVPVQPVMAEPAPVEAVRAEPVPAERIIVTVVDRLAAGQAAEQVELSVDGSYVGSLSIDQRQPTAVLEIPLDGPGSMSYEVAVEGVSALGETYAARGAAEVDVEDGSTLHLSLDPVTGGAALVHGAPVG